MTRTEADKIAEAVKEIARSAAFHSDDMYEKCWNLSDLLVEIFHEEKE